MHIPNYIIFFLLAPLHSRLDPIPRHVSSPCATAIISIIFICLLFAYLSGSLKIFFLNGSLNAANSRFAFLAPIPGHVSNAASSATTTFLTVEKTSKRVFTLLCVVIQYMIMLIMF